MEPRNAQKVQEPQNTRKVQKKNSNIFGEADLSVSSVVYKFPIAAKFGRVIFKSKIYDHATPNSKVKELFVREVEKIIWSYKLSPATINLPASDGVQEIQVLSIFLRTGELSQEVLRTIDKAIPSPILFELKYGGKIKYAASYKRPSEVDKDKWVLSSFYGTTEYTENTESTLRDLPVVLNMGALYEALLLNFMPMVKRDGESFQHLLERVEKVQSIEREVVKLGNLIKKTKQFNRRVELNRELNWKKAEIEVLRK